MWADLTRAAFMVVLEQCLPRHIGNRPRSIESWWLAVRDAANTEYNRAVQARKEADLTARRDE